MLGIQWADALEPKGVTVALLQPGIVSTDSNPAGGISVAESAEGLLAVLEKVRVGDGAKGLLGYDGTTVRRPLGDVRDGRGVCFFKKLVRDEVCLRKVKRGQSRHSGWPTG